MLRCGSGPDRMQSTSLGGRGSVVFAGEPVQQADEGGVGKYRVEMRQVARQVGFTCHVRYPDAMETAMLKIQPLPDDPFDEFRPRILIIIWWLMNTV